MLETQLAALAARSLITLLTTGVSLLLFCNLGAAVTFDWVTIRDPGNPEDDNGLGSVLYSYRISRFETTQGQYAEFLNAVDPAGLNPKGIYE